MGGDRSPLQLWVAEESTRQWWRERYEIDVSESDAAMVQATADSLGYEISWIRAA
jgi:hypothetical protein